MKIFRPFILFIETLLVLFYVFFEELVWERLIVPVREWIEKRIGQRVIALIDSLSATTAFVIFAGSLLTAEGFGLAAAPVALLVNPFVGAILYLLKVLMAAFSFWFFAQTKSKLLQIAWFSFLYEKTIYFYEWIKSTELYKSVKRCLAAMKASIKEYISRLPKGELRKIYKSIKSLFKRSDEQSS
ncbi:MAG: hypothetical protein C6H99_01075 [Epsilonproteobacteria bacterium]|nr:hypothetical protein [Campylobacterota bacterium]NPA63565.1 hypothetical protein [Campylobacterota bacterium]